MSAREHVIEDVGSISGRPRNRKPATADQLLNKAIEENMTLKKTVDDQRRELIRLRGELERLRLTKSINRGDAL